MKIKNCIKGYVQGINKVIPPKQTLKVVLRKIKNIDPPILERFNEVLHPSKIPQYRFIGTDYYQRVCQSEGTNGKGHFKEQALASGIMELVERYSCNKYIRNKKVMRLSTFNALTDNIFQLQEIYSNCINETYVRTIDDNTLKKVKLSWHQGYTLDGKRVFLPMLLIAHLLEGTNGMASGNSLEEALLHGICEVIERHCLTLINLNKIVTPLIKISTINYPIAKELIGKFQSLKQEIYIKDFSLGIGLPVIGVVRNIDGRNCLITAGVATTSEEALIRALTENSQADGKINYVKISAAKHYFINDKVVAMEDIPTIENKDLKSELDNIKRILNAQNMRAYFLNTTDKELDLPSVMVFIAGAKYFDASIAYRNLWVAIIEMYIKNGDYGSAEKYLGKAIKCDKKNRAYYVYIKGVLLKRTGRYREAMKYFRKVLKEIGIAEFKRNSLFNLGLCSQALNQVDNAVKYYKKVIKFYPEFRIEFLTFDNDVELFKRAKIIYQGLERDCHEME